MSVDSQSSVRNRPAPIVRILAIALVCGNAGGNYCLSRGMRAVGATVSLSPLDYLRAMTNPWVLIGIALLIGWLISQLSLLSWADLTYVLPITAVSYVLAAILGAIFLGERVSFSRWAGVALIFGGVILVGRTRPRTAPVPEDRESE